MFHFLDALKKQDRARWKPRQSLCHHLTMYSFVYTTIQFMVNYIVV